MRLITTALSLILLCTSLAQADDTKTMAWTEGEAFVEATNTQRSNISDKPTASGGKSLFGPALDRKGLIVRYEIDLPGDLKSAEVSFRYARLHWKDTMVPAKMELKLTGPGEAIAKTIAFDDTKGWGRTPAQWGMLKVPVGAMAAGTWTMTLTSLADNNSVNLDGFLLTEEDPGFTADVLTPYIRLTLTSDGLTGLALKSTALRQGKDSKVLVAVLGPGKTTAPTASIAGKDGTWKTLKDAPGQDGEVYPFALGKLGDGEYRLRIRNKKPAADMEIQLTLLGEFLSTLDERIAKVEAASAKIAASDDPAVQAAKADFEHAVEFLQAGREMMGKSTVDADKSAWKKHLAQHEGLSDPSPLAKRLAVTLEQFEETIKRIDAGKAPYEGRTGQFRRAYRSKASGDLLVYRSLVPGNYDKADSVPMILMLHGGGGDENTFHDMDGGKILDILDQRGYLMVTPKYHRRTQPTYAEDLLQLIELTQAQYPKVDPKRIYVTGISMGGHTTFLMATGNPDLFAGACCVSGSTRTEPEKAKALKTTPLMLLHGGGDTVVPPATAKATAAKMKEFGYPYELHIFPDHGHEYHAEQYITMTLDFFEKHGPKK